MSVTAAIRKMLAAGLTIEQALIASEAFEAETPKDSQAERRRAKDRERKRLRKSAESAESVESAESPSPKKETSPTPPKEKITPSTVSEARASSTEMRAGFDEFWSMYPNKVGKRDAEREFAMALKRSPLSDILAGLRRYVAKTDDRPWCNPSTFLHQNRWDDQPAAAPPRGQGPPPGNRKPNAVDAMHQIFQERGWTSEPEILRSDHSDDQRVPPERSGYSGAVVDLRSGAYRRV